jgi:hypothetical protein
MCSCLAGSRCTLSRAAAQQCWWRGSRGAASPPASQVQQEYHVCCCCCTGISCTCSSTTVRVVRGRQPAPLPHRSSKSIMCAAAVSLAHTAAQQWRGSRGAASPPALHVHVLMHTKTLLVLVLGKRRETTIFQTPMTDDHPTITITTRPARGHAAVCATQRAQPYLISNTIKCYQTAFAAYWWQSTFTSLRPSNAGLPRPCCRPKLQPGFTHSHHDSPETKAVAAF